MPAPRSVGGSGRARAHLIAGALAAVLACATGQAACSVPSHRAPPEPGESAAPTVRTESLPDAAPSSTTQGDAPAEPTAPPHATTTADSTNLDHHALCPTVPVPDRRVYATWQRFALTHAQHGIDGALRVLEDSRFTRPGAQRLGTHPLVPPCDALPARIEVLDAGGTVQQHVELLPQLDVHAPRFAPDETLFRVRELVQCLASCWCGDRVSFWQVRDGRFARLKTRRSSGALATVPSVIEGCYEGTRIAVAMDGQPVLLVHRTTMVIPGPLEIDERHFFDGTEWRTTASQRTLPW